MIQLAARMEAEPGLPAMPPPSWMSPPTPITPPAPAAVSVTTATCRTRPTAWLKAIRSHTDRPARACRPRSMTGRPNACNLCHLDRDPRVDGGAPRTEWYGQKIARVSAGRPADLRHPSFRRSAAMPGQRALNRLAHGLGAGPPGLRRRGSPPYLAQLLDDPYSDRPLHRASFAQAAARVFEHLPYDYIAPRGGRAPGARAASSNNGIQTKLASLPPATILGPDATCSRLLQERNDKSMYLQE